MSRLDYKDKDAAFRASKHAGARPRIEFRTRMGSMVKVIANRDIVTPEDPSLIPPPPYGASEAQRVAYEKSVDRAKSTVTVVRNTGPKHLRISTKGFIDMSLDEWTAFKEAVDEAIKDAVDLP